MLQVGVRMLQMKISKITLKMHQKRVILSLRNRIHHTNLTTFFGLTELDDELLVVSEFCSRGSLAESLQNERLEIGDDVKSAICHDITAAMAYLHSMNICHGFLRSQCCLLDAKWTVKVSPTFFKS